MNDNEQRSFPAALGAAIRRIMGPLVDASVRRARRGKNAGPALRGSTASFAALKSAVKARGLLDRQPAYYATRLTAALALHAGAAAWVGWTRASALVWIGAPLLAFSSGQLVLLAHDAAHRAVFGSRRANDVLALILINVLNGGSHGWWAGSHNEHHARSNDRDLDPDIDYPVLAFSEEQAARKDARFRPLLERQHYLVWMLMSFVGLSMHVYSAAWLLRHRRRRLEIAGFAAFYAVFPPLVVGALGLGRGLVFMLVQQALFGLYLGSITAANHWGMPMPAGAQGLDFVRHQVTTSRNIAGPLCDLWYGGLNRQIEHHLFPTMPRNNLEKARPLVRAFCAAHGIDYHEVGPVEAYREIFSTLRRVARSVSARVDDRSDEEPIAC